MSNIFDGGSFFYNKPFENAGDVWTHVPTNAGIFLYSVLTPMICLCGILGNLLCLLVLTKKTFAVCSFYVYLRAISTVDLAACVVTFMSGLARGALWWRDGWAAYDALISIPLGGFLSSLSTYATVFVTLDRLTYLKNPLRRCKPKFCSRKMAAKILGVGIVVSIMCTLPFCFIFKFTDDGTLETTPFYNSRFYHFYSWFDLNLFAIFPMGILLIGNTMLILSIKKTQKLQKKCRLLTGKTRKLRDQSKLTATLIMVVFFHLIGELPTHFTARKTAAYILFGGDDQKADCSVSLEIAREVTTVLNALHLAIKFMLYCYFCPPFCRALKTTIVGRPPKEKQRRVEAANVPVKLFLVEEDVANKKLKLDLSQLGFMNMFINTKAAQEYPRIIY